MSVRGAGFGTQSLVLFGEVAATQVTRAHGTERRRLTPPGVNGAVTLTALNADDGSAQHSFNYGSPQGLFGRLNDSFACTTPRPPAGTKLLFYRVTQ